MISSHHAQFCDICGDKGPCFYCGRKKVEISDKKYIIDYIYDARSIVAVEMAPSGHITKKDITKKDLDDLYIEVYRLGVNDPIFGIYDQIAGSFFDKKPLVIKATKPFLSKNGLTIIMLGIL